MVYKKYVYKKGKKFGPYYYESYRVGNQVKKRYIGTSLPSPTLDFIKSRTTTFLPILLLIFILGVILLSQIIPSSILGKVIMQEDSSSEKGSSISIPEELESAEQSEEQESQESEEKGQTVGIPEESQETEEETPSEEESEEETPSEELNVETEENLTFEANIKFMPIIQDAKGNLIPAEVKVLDSMTKDIKLEKSSISEKSQISIASSNPDKLAQGLYDIEIIPENNIIKKIKIKEARINADVNQLINIDDSPESENSIKTYAIDPSMMNFKEASVTAVAVGNELWKCKNWNFTLQECYGEWIFLQSITPGEEYSFLLTPDDPGFGEILITNAEHLNSTRGFISDIDDEVRAQDDIWSEPIYTNEFVRATFDTNMTNDNVINLVVRNNESKNTSVEVYEKDGSQILGTTPVITASRQYDIQLSGMSGYNNVFDIRVVNAENNSGAYLEFDYIKDEPGNLQCGTGSTGTCPNATNPCVGSTCTYASCVCVVSANQTIDNATTYTFDSLTVNSGVIVSISTNAAGGVGAQTTGPPGANDSVKDGGNGGAGGDGYTAGGGKAGGNTSGGGGGGGTFLTTYVAGVGGSKGGGGGAGAGYAAICAGGSGGAGGGTVTFNCSNLINIIGTLQANATNGGNGGLTGSIGCGGAGGGGGGQINLKASNVTVSGTVRANGANGGNGGGGVFPGGGGGGGGGGFINVSATYYSHPGTVQALGGLKGLKGAVGGSAADGVDGSAGVIVNYTILDTTYPQFSNFWDNNASLTESGLGLFNVTVTNTNGTVWIEINNTNITARNLTANIYNASYNFLRNGTYAYKWWAYGNGISHLLNSSAIRYYTVNATSDSAAPQISIIYPGNTTYNINVSALNYTYSDANPGFCWYSNNSGIWNSTSVNAGVNFTNVISNEGSNTWTLYCNDSLGNKNSSTITFSIDSIYPTINFTSPTETSGSLINTRNNIVVNVTANDTNLQAIRVYLYNSTKGEINSTSISSISPLFINFTSLANGLYFFNASANDSAGNINWTETRNVTIFYDVTFPQVSIIYPENTTYNVNVSTLNYTITEANPDKCWYSLNGGQNNVTITCGNNVTGLTSTEGSNTWIVWANDIAGNINTSSITFNKDTISLNITSTFVSPYDPAVAYNVTLNAIATDNIGISGIFVNITLPDTTVITRSMPMSNYTIQIPGRHNVTFWANDTAGNVGNSSADYFIAGSSRVDVQFNTINNDSVGIPVNLTIYFAGTDKQVHEHNFTGIYADNYTTLLYDLLFGALGNNISLRLNEVNLSLDNNATLGLDMYTGLTGYLVTYGINSTYNFTNATLVLSYAGTGFTNENYLGLYKCSNWNFTGQTCLGTWESVTGTQDTTADTFTIIVTSFSGYAIKQESVPPTPPSPEGPSGEAGVGGGAAERFDVSIKGNYTGSYVDIRINKKGNASVYVSDVQINITYDSKAFVLVTDADGIVRFKPSVAGNYTFEFKRRGYMTAKVSHIISECAPSEEKKPIIEYIPEIYEKAKQPIKTVAIVLAVIFLIFIIIKVLRMRKREREFHHKFIRIRRWNGRIRDNDEEDEV